MKSQKLNKVPYVFVSSLCGYVAMWATRQSPYSAPDALTTVLFQFNKRIKERIFVSPSLAPYPDTICCSHDVLLPILKEELLSIQEVRLWNERKNGNQSPYGFCSRYDNPDPDDDFIDLDALIGNIYLSCAQEHLENHKEYQRSMRFSFRRVWNDLRYRFYKPSIPQPHE